MVEDPPGEAPWAMQLVVRVERSAPPTRTAACAAAAVAVVRLLADDRALPGGEWHPQVRRWTDGAIRKHCRRARGVAWERVEALPGVTVSAAGAEVRALVPTGLDALPREVDRLQLSGSELDDPDVLRKVDPVPGGPVVVSLCPEPFLPLGKAAAACGHAAQLTAMRMPARRLATWSAAGFPVVVEHPDVARWTRLRPQAAVEVVDAGFTVVAPGTSTALARWA
ncbi:peptidyl-tRNA hydrolase [Geodermatophilus normandii]|uniref:Peptidyl-tRNA hydrolase n=1 Tax=Geodermatophilus normandii TaxID=1137989 RepID=A0A6P0GQ41_9ACTN|nr:peptidyl-tRNA hydrolase [Geodermatophilus normandii]NEM09001.1 peptidyl-tRNA hydrolase [Geodermatophilus normandii]